MKAALLVWILITVPTLAVSQSRAIDASGTDWKNQVLVTAPGERIELTAIRAESLTERNQADADFKLILQRKRITDAGSVVLVHSSSGTETRSMPKRHYFEGYVAGDLNSRALLIIGQDSKVRGLVRQNGRVSALIAQPAGLSTVQVETERVAEPFSCGSDQLTPPPADVASKQGLKELPVAGIPPEGFLARIALETDYPYFQRFGNVDQAVVYAMDLTAFSSTIYDDEVSTRMALSSISIWTDPSDPWTQSSSICQLYEFGRFWNDNRNNIDRSVAHLLSGRSANSGVAWVGTMCGGSFNVDTQNNCPGLAPQIDNYGGNYGFSGGIDGNFDLSNPSAVWDIIVFAHELGHNFNSPHTHCYNGLGGNASPVDECHNGQAAQGCYAGPQSLPGPTGQGSGTIMSYCHLLGGGLSNIGFSLGLDHPFGVEPQRVPDRMMTHVINRESFNPGCFTTELGPALYLNAVDTSLVEGDALELTIGVDPVRTSDVTVDLSQTAGLAGTFSNLSGHVIPANQAEITVQLPTVDDAVFTDTLSGAIVIDQITSLLPILGDATLAVTVEDNDPAEVSANLSLDTAEVTEGGIATATVSLTGTVLEPVEVTLAVTPALAALLDTQPAPQIIDAGQLSTDFVLQFIDDEDYQQGRTGGTISIQSISSDAAASIGTLSALSLTVIDNDLPDTVLTVDSFEGN